MEFYSDELFAKSLVADNTYDKLQFLPNEKRDKLANFFTSLKLSPEQEKEYVNHSTLAMYYSKRLQQPYDYVFDNIDSFNKEYFGEELNINAAYDRLNQQLNKDYFEKQKQQQEQLEKENKINNQINATYSFSNNQLGVTNQDLQISAKAGKEILSESGHTFGAFSMQGAKTISNVAVSFWDLLVQDAMKKNELHHAAAVGSAKRKGLISEEEAKQKLENYQKEIVQVQENRKKHLQNVHDYFQPEIEDYLKQAKWDNPDATLPQGIKILIAAIPQLSIQTGLNVLTGGASTAIFGTAMALDKDAELLINNPDMSPQDRGINAIITGVINMADQLQFSKLMKSGANKELKATALKAIKFYSKNIAKEGATEGVQELFENLIDIYTGVYGDPDKLSMAKKVELARQNILSSMFVGAVVGGVMSTPNYKSLAKFDEEALAAKRTLQSEADKIRTKDNPTDEEIQYLDQLDTLIETSDPMDLIQAKQEVELINMAKEQQEIADRDKFIEQYGEEAYMKYKAQEAIEEQMVIKTSRTPNYQQMKIKINDIQRLYPNVNIELAQNYDNLSEEEKVYVDKNSYGKGVKGYYNKDTDKVVIFADNIKNQSELEKTFAHETAGHKGLETLLGNDYNNVLNQIYEEVKTNHAAELQKLAETYGKNLEVAADQKYVLEEFLANQADLEQAGFFKSLVQKIKMALRKCGFNAKWTDNEIKTLLRRSLAKQQKERVEDKQKVTGTNGENGTRFAKTEGKYSIKNAISSKKGYTVEYVNENAGVALNNAKGVICEEINQVFNPNDVPDKGFKGWIAQKVREYVNSHPIKGTYDVPALNGKVSVVDSSIRSLGNHGGPDEKFNLIPVIPEMLKNSILIQTESFQNRSKSHLLASKVRYGKNNRYIAIMIIHESNGQFYYDHSLLILKEGKLGQKINAENQNGNPAKTAGSNSNSASVLNVAQNALLSSGFDVKSEKNLRFSLNEGENAENFKKWFGDSKVVDENGEPLVVYHGSSAEFTVFSHKFAMRNGAADGRGFYFTSDKSKAEGYKTESGKLFEVYLRLQKPLQPNELTITKNELEKIIRAIDVDGDYVSNYAEDDRGYPGKVWFDKAVKRAATMIYESSDDNADIIAEIYSSFGQGDALAKITEATGYDGFIKDDVFVVFSPNQIKSATDNIGTFDKNNPDIRFSIAEDESLELEVRQAFPKYHAEQAKEVLKNLNGKDLKNNDTGIEAKINSNQYNKMVSNAAVNKSLINGFSRDEHFEALANIENLFQNAVLLEKTEDLKNNDPNVKIYRFASPLVINNEIADALITVKESIDSNSTRIYSLELTEIKKLSERGGILKYHTDSINKLQQKHEKIKSFLEKNQKNLRFLKNYNPDEPFQSDSDKERMITVLMGVGKEKLNSMSGEEAKVYLEERLFDTDENTAQSVLNTARTRYKEIIKSYQQNKKTNWINENYPFYRHVKELGGENAKIYLPKSEIYKNYKGQFFTRKKGEGIDLDVLVNKIAEIGFDGKDLKEKVLKFFNGLTPAKLTRAYRESLIDTESKTLQEHENYLLDKLKSKKTFSKREEKEIKTLKEKYIALGLDLNIEDIAVIEDKPQIQDVSEQKLSKKKNTKTLTADEKLALQRQYRSELIKVKQKYASLYQQKLALQTEALQEEYRTALKELKQAAYDDKRDIKNVQKIAANFAHKFLPTELHKKFTTAILNLSYKSNTYGKGELLTRRRKALNQLLDSIAQEAQEFERKKNLEILQKKLDSIHSRVNQSRKKVTTRNFETQETLDHIVEISRMSDSLIAEQLEDLKNEHEFFLASGQDTAEIEYQLKLYKTFGSLQNKNASDLQYAIGLLSEIERNGRNAFKELLGTRKAADSVKINYLIDTITRGKGLLSGQSELQNEIKQLEAKFKRPKEELLKLFKMEDFIYILSAANKGKDWLETPLGKIYQRVHNSQVNKDTMLRTFSEKYNAAIDKALGSTNAVNRAAAVQKLRKRIEKTGIYVYGFNTAKDISYIKMDIETARNKLADFDSGKKNMPFYQAEFLRDRLESLDVRMQKTYKREKTDGITEHILTELDKIEKQDNFKSIAIPVINLKSKEKTEWTNVNQMELLTLYLLSRQRDARYKLFFTGFDDAAISQAEKLMLPELKQLADDMTNYLTYLGDELDKVTMNLYGTKLDRVPFYFPLTTRRVETDGKKLKEEKAISENAPQALSLGSLKKRNAHIMQIEIGDAFDTFHRHALKTIHYISWAETARELRAVFMNKDAVKAMNQVFGKEFYQEFQKSIVDTVNGGNIDLSDNKTLKFLVSNATSIKMMFNYLSGLKQIPSFIAYSNDVPLKAVMKGMSYALRHPKQVFDVLNQTPYFKNRLESGPDIMARLILDRANRISGKKDAMVGVWNEWGSIFTRYGDATALILGGYGVYKYHYDRMIEQGFSHDDANKHALTRFEMSTESLMQSGAVHMQNAWQRNGLGGKLLTAWKSSQILNSQRGLREMFAQAYFGNDNNDPFTKDIKSYTKYLEDRIKNNNLFATEAEKKQLLKFYKDFPLGKVIKNKWGESLIFAPQDHQNLNDYIQHFAVKRDYNKNIENFSQNFINLFPQIEKSLKDPDERILTMVNDTPRIAYLKKIQTKNGNHLIVTSITPDGRIIFWTHMDSKDNYIEKQREAEKKAIEQYGLMDGNGNKVYMSYDNYLKNKKNIPLYLATAEPYQVGNLQVELLDRNINLAQKNDLSSKIGKNSYTGTEISDRRHKIWLAQIINSMVVSTFVKFIGDLAGGYGLFDDDEDDSILEHLADLLMSNLGEQLSIFPIWGDVAQIGIGALSSGGGMTTTDKYMLFDEAKKGFWATKKLINSEAEAEEIFDIAAQMLRTSGLMSRTAALTGSTLYQAKRLYNRVFGDDKK